MSVSLADRVLSGDLKVKPLNISVTKQTHDERVAELRDQIVHAKRLFGNNVIEWCHSNLGQQVHLDEIPCQKAPWPVMWVEYDHELLAGETAVLVRDLTLDEIKGMIPDQDFLDLCVPDLSYGHTPDEIDGYTFFDLYMTMHGRLVGPLCWIVAVLDKNGKMIGNAWRLASDLPVRGKGDVTEESLMLSFILPTFWVLGFLHCRNIETQEVSVPDKVRAKRARKLGHDPLRFERMLISVPSSKGSSKGSGTGEGKALHIVAGHFSHYGNCCPGIHPEHKKLLGRLEGVYWMPSHARGNAERGVVLSDVDMKVDDTVHIEPGVMPHLVKDSVSEGRIN